MYCNKNKSTIVTNCEWVDKVINVDKFIDQVSSTAFPNLVEKLLNTLLNLEISIVFDTNLVSDSWWKNKKKYVAKIAL